MWKGAIYSFNQFILYLSSAYQKPAAIVGAGDTAVNETDKNPIQGRLGGFLS